MQKTLAVSGFTVLQSNNNIKSIIRRWLLTAERLEFLANLLIDD